MSWWYWPARLEVTKGASYWYKGTGGTTRAGVTAYWYEGEAEIAIIPWIIVNIYDFYVELNIDGKSEKAKLFREIEDEYGNRRKSEIGKGYRLQSNNPIGPEYLSFEFMVKGQRIDTATSISGFVVLEAGVRKEKHPIRKPITLKPI